MPEREHMPDGPGTEGATHREGAYRFFEEGISNADAWDLFESQIRVEEKEPGKFDEGSVSTLATGINRDLKTKPDLQLAMKDMLRARLLYKNLRNALEVGAAEEYSDIISRMLEAKDNKTVLGLVGMDVALNVLENTAYWRDKNMKITPAQRLSIARGIGSNVAEMAQYRAKFDGIDLSSFTDEEMTMVFKGRLLFMKDEADFTDKEREEVALLTPEERAYINALDATRKKAAVRVVDQVERDLTLAETMYNATGESAKMDGVVLKDGDYTSVRGLTVEDGNHVKLKDVPLIFDDDSRGIHININLAGVLDLSERAELGGFSQIDWVRKNKPQLIAMAWDRVWRDFFKDHWEEIDFDKSLGGKASGLIKKRFYNPIRYEKSDEANPGEAAYLRRYTYVGVLPMTMLAMRGVRGQLEEWDTATKLATAGRLKNGDEVRKMFTEKSPGLLNDPNAINAGDLKPLASIIGAMGYLPHEEQMEMGAHWLEGLVTYRLRYNKKDFNYENIDSRQAEVMLRTAWGLHLIDEEAEKIISHKILGNPLIVYMVTSLQAGEPAEAVLDMVKAFFKAVVGSK